MALTKTNTEFVLNMSFFVENDLSYKSLNNVIDILIDMYY